MFGKRRQVFTNLNVQVRLALVFLFCAFMLIICLACLFVINYAKISSKTDGLEIQNQLIAKMLLIEQAQSLGIYYGLAMLVFVGLMTVYVVVYAHRLVGPIHKMNMILEKAIQEKDWPKPVKFRKGDAFHEFAHKFNKFVETMSGSKPR